MVFRVSFNGGFTDLSVTLYHLNNTKALYMLNMKKIFIVMIAALTGFTAEAQTKTTNSTKQAAPPRTYASATPSSFESDLISSGKVRFSKAFKQGDGKDFVAIYSIRNTGERNLEQNRPIQVKLGRESFDSVFTKTTADMAAKWKILDKYITDNKISLTEERGWVNVLTYYNGLQ